MELKLTDMSVPEHKDCFIEVFYNKNKLSHISFLMFCCNDVMLEELPLVINGDHQILIDGQDQSISSDGDNVTFSFDDSNSNLELILPKDLCVPIFQEMIKLYSS